MFSCEPHSSQVFARRRRSRSVRGPQIRKGASSRTAFFQRQSSLAAVVDDSQYGFGRAHLADLPVRVSGHLPPFPLWTVFPPSEYYGGSVALRLAARRAIPPSPGAGRLERDVGAPSAPLNGVIPHRSPRGRFRRRRLCRPIAVAPTSDAVSGMYACIPGDWGSNNAVLTLSRGPCGTPPSASSGRSRFDGMLRSPLAFAAG